MRVFKRLKKKIRYIFVFYDRAQFRNYFSRETVKEKKNKNILLYVLTHLRLIIAFMIDFLTINHTIVSEPSAVRYCC